MLVWFARNIPLNDLLAQWRGVRANYQPDQPVDPAWHVDGQSVDLGPADDDSLFRAAVGRLFAFRIFPGDMLAFAADFTLEDRTPAPGDHVVQRVRVIPFLLDVVVMCIVTAVWHESDRRGFTLVTSERHYGMGEWTATVSRKRGAQTNFLMHAVFRPTRLTWLTRRIARAVQLRAFHRAREFFRQSVLQSEERPA